MNGGIHGLPYSMQWMTWIRLSIILSFAWVIDFFRIIILYVMWHSRSLFPWVSKECDRSLNHHHTWGLSVAPVPIPAAATSHSLEWKQERRYHMLLKIVQYAKKYVKNETERPISVAAVANFCGGTSMSSMSSSLTNCTWWHGTIARKRPDSSREHGSA